ncbi:MAG TPA: hypothetical protein DCY13_12955, partial [Verrucomicrobiales bacterium]|nr:hypothetical protein [Verrucomicrobiales bacterium]
ADGHLWVATWIGLSRFNGTVFINFDPGNTPELLSETISDIATGPDGRLWAATHDGLYEVRGRGFVRTGAEHGLASSKTYSVAWSSTGAMWVCTRRGLTRIQDGRMESIVEDFAGENNYPQNLHSLPDGRMIVFTTKGPRMVDEASLRLVPLPFELTLHGPPHRHEILGPDAQGTVWFRTDEGICRWKPGADAELAFPVTEDFAGKRTLLLTDSHGDVWMAGDGLGVLERWSNGRRSTLDLGIRHGITSFNCMIESADGTLWVGTGQGLVLMKPRAARGYGLRHGLPHEFIYTTTPLPDGRVVAGTRRWFGIVDETRATITSVRIPGIEPHVRSMIAAEDGGVWMATAQMGPVHVAWDGVISVTALARGWRNPREIHAFQRDRHGRLWVGHADGLHILDGEESTFLNKDSDPAIGDGGVRVIQEMSDGTVWIGCRGHGITVIDGRRTRHITEAEGLSHPWVWSLYEERPGVIWAGTNDGLTRITDGRCEKLSTADGLIEGMVHAILPDRDGYLWLTGLKGLHRIDPAEVGAYLGRRTGKITVISLDAEDGLLNAETNGEQQPAGFVSTTGRLWVPTIAGVAVVDPTRFRDLPAPDLPVIQRVVLDDEIIYDTGPGPGGAADYSFPVPFAPGRGRMLEIDFAAPGVELVDRAQYEVKLSGYDRDWRKLGTQTTARYTNLRPGRYEFEVRVAGHHNIWSAARGGLRFTLSPYFFKTAPFYLICAAGILGAGFWLHRRKLSIVSRIQALEQRAALISERERIARDMHDDLGSRLTHISLLAELANRTPDKPPTGRLDELNQAARQAARAVEEIVWAANPGNDTLDSLVAYILQYASNQLNTAGIACRIDATYEWPENEVFPETRHSVFLAFKEAVNNIIKHAGAREVRLSVQPQYGEVMVRISDDGVGFDASEAQGADHDGLRNMKARLRSVGGRLTIESRTGEGTTVEMWFPA